MKLNGKRKKERKKERKIEKKKERKKERLKNVKEKNCMKRKRDGNKRK